MKKYLFFSILIFILLFSAFAISAKDGKIEKTDKKVIDEIAKTGKAKVIVVMKDPEKTGTKKLMNAVEEGVSKENINHEFSSLNAFSASLNSKELAELEKDDNVAEIYYNRPVRISLEDSAPLINASKSWALQSNTLNLTGKGQTICIIDTGVDYNHPDLGNCTPVKRTLNGTNESYVLESAHPYADNFDYTWSITKPGYSKIAVHFVNISLERSYDYIYVLDGDYKTAGIYSGEIEDIWSPSVNGDTIHIRLISDYSVHDYGFYIDLLINGTTNTTYDWSNCSKVMGGWNTYSYTPDPKDDNGHGTHVSGIVAANGSINGVAPEAKIVSIKALDSGGNGDSGDVNAGIEWCINHSEEYNIRVISMSLGGSINYTSYCDAYDTLTAAVINAATAKNISVLVASGNSANYTAISSPACMQNAIPIGSTTKTDAISSFSNRYGLLNLFAPGGTSVGTGACSPGSMDSNRICSTKLSGGYISMSGTSMATPHAAGVFAIVNEYLKSVGRSMTPNEIEAVLNKSGKIIHDSSTGINYSRIDVYEAIILLDNSTVKNVSFSAESEINGSHISRNSIVINASESNILSLSNLTISLYNSSSLVNSTATTASSSYVNITELNDGIYYFNASGYGVLGKIDSETRALTIDTANPGISYGEESESPGSLVNNRTNIAVNITVSDTNLANLTVNLYNSTSLVNSTGSTEGNYLNFTNLADGVYYFNASAIDFAGNVNYTETRNVTINGNPPRVLIVSPGATTYNANSYSINIGLNEEGYCEFSLNGGVTNESLTNSGNTSFTESKSGIANGAYTLRAYCNDSFGNNNYTESVSFSIDVQSGSGSGSGSTGGGGPATAGTTFVPSEEQASKGYTANLGSDDKIKFGINSETHLVSMAQIGTSSATITIQSEPINVTLNRGDEKKLSVSTEGYYDLYLKLNGIANEKANLTIRIINEIILEEPKLSPAETKGEETAGNGGVTGNIINHKENRKINWVWAIAGAFVIAIALIFFGWEKLLKKAHKKEGIKAIVSKYR